MEKKKRGAGLILTSLFAALICAGCFIQIPLPGGIPIVIQDMMAFLSGLLLGPILGSAAVLIFIIIGCLGLPVFTGKAGISVILAGPTGGFIIGYLIAAFLGGLVLSLAFPLGKKHGKAKQFVWISVAAFLATVAAFASGLVGFSLVTHKTVLQSIPLVVLPFIPGNIIKLVACVFLTKKFRPVIHSYLN